VPASADILEDFPFECGLNELASASPSTLRVFAYTQRGFWCWSNSGVVYDVATDELTFIDVLTDIKHTQKMLDEVRELFPTATFKNLVYTHCDVDHIGGQELVYGQVDNIYAREACRPHVEGFYASNMGQKVKLLHYLWRFGGHLGIKYFTESLLFKDLFLKREPEPWIPKWIAKASMAQFFESFDFDKIDYNTHMGTNVKLPNVWVGDEGLEISVGAKGRETLKLLPSPVPSHSDHDLVVHVPAAKVHFMGDILFNAVTPVMWAGTFDQCVAVCDHYARLSGTASFLVPGHGPIQHAKQKPFQKMKAYWQHLGMEVSGCR